MRPVQFICLAHSKKYSERCVAGLLLDSGAWIRPISRKKHGELPPAQMLLTNNTELRNFDIVGAMLAEHAPMKNQPENWRIQPSPWNLISRPAPAEQAALLRKALFHGPALFGNTLDRVAIQVFERTPATESLVLTKPESPRWTVRRTVTWKKQMRVKFLLGSVIYDLAVTDIPYDDKLKDMDLGEYSSEQLGIRNESSLYFTISLGEPLDNGWCYKLVAAVLQLPTGWPSLQ